MGHKLLLKLVNNYIKRRICVGVFHGDVSFFRIVNIIIKSGENWNKNSKNVENIWCSIYNGNTHIERGGKSV